MNRAPLKCSRAHPSSKVAQELRHIAKVLREAAERKPETNKQAQAFADWCVAGAQSVDYLTILEMTMARTAVAIDKLEARIDDLNTGIAARDRKIVSLTTQLATAQQNTLDDADTADLTRVEGQTFDPIPPVDDGSTTTPPATTTPTDGTTTPAVTPGA